jgi:hypothetical protein
MQNISASHDHLKFPDPKSSQKWKKIDLYLILTQQKTQTLCLSETNQEAKQRKQMSYE